MASVTKTTTKNKSRPNHRGSYDKKGLSLPRSSRAFSTESEICTQTGRSIQTNSESLADTPRPPFNSTSPIVLVFGVSSLSSETQSANVFGKEERRERRN